MRRSYHHGDLRRALLEEAVAAAGEVGLERLSLRDLAARVGVTHPAAYHHFASKSALLAALAEEGFLLLDAALAAVPREEPPRARFVKLGVAYVAFARAYPVHFRLMFRESVVRPSWDSDIAALAASAFARVDEAVSAAGGDQDLTDLSWAAMHGLATLALDGPLALRGDDIDGLVARLTALLARLLPG
jgi:AcrR family transcriptional regulator